MPRTNKLNSDDEQPSATAEVATEPVETAPLPFWAATSDKQARLERLRATAIEVPEPEVQPAATGAPTEATPEVSREIPGLAFDEGFRGQQKF